MNHKLKRHNMFSGVFLPTFLAIIGAILYLRLGYIVGGAGILGTVIIILISISVTICTALSLSSITTNIEIGPGGAYSIISKTLGISWREYWNPSLFCSNNLCCFLHFRIFRRLAISIP